MAVKLLLVAFTTTRMVSVAGKDEERRVRFQSKSVVDLTEDEIALLDRLTKSTGKLHYRAPISEGGAAPVASDPEIVAVPDYAGQDVPVAKKSVEQLKAYLTFHEIDFAGVTGKAALGELVAQHEAGAPAIVAGEDAGDDGDPDSGL